MRNIRIQELRENYELSLEYLEFSSAETNDDYFLLIPDLIPIWKGREEYHFVVPIVRNYLLETIENNPEFCAECLHLQTSE